MPNKLSQFWSELKRRKVVRVITVYAAAAFVILELVSIIVEPLKLPEWFLSMVIVLLCIGFIVAIILSWIYDIHPEGGVVKTKPAHKVKEGDMWDSTKSWKIASYISFVVIVGLIILNIIPRAKLSEEFTDLETSIAVLPFDNMSVGEEYSHMGDAITDEIILELQKIHEFDRVLSRSSTMQFRENRPTIPEIAEKLGVNYIIEGSIQRREEDLSIRVQVIRAKHEDHVWADEYDRKWVDIHTIQDEIAFKIAHELKTALSPEEKQLIEKIPTRNLTAYNLYQRGRNEYWKFVSDDDNREALERAEDLYNQALEHDSTFAQAYTGLASVYYFKNVRSENEYFSETYLDTVLILSDIALFYDDQLAEAYSIKGICYSTKGHTAQAIEELNKAIELNPNDYLAYYLKGILYENIALVKSIDNTQKAVSLNHGPDFEENLRSLSRQYAQAGFTEEANYYLQEALRLDGDSGQYYRGLVYAEMSLGNYEKAIEYGEKRFAIDSNRPRGMSHLGDCYMLLGQYEESLKYFKIWIERLKATGNTTSSRMHLIGYAYWQNGYKEEAEYYFNEQIKNCNIMNEMGRSTATEKQTYYYLAEVYAFRGEKDKAYDNLKIFNQRQTMISEWVARIKISPFFNDIRDEPEFQQIVNDIEAKYLAEHERVRQWLEENDAITDLLYSFDSNISRY